VPEIVPEAEKQKKRYREAEMSRTNRLEDVRRKKKASESTDQDGDAF